MEPYEYEQLERRIEKGEKKSDDHESRLQTLERTVGEVLIYLEELPKIREHFEATRKETTEQLKSIDHHIRQLTEHDIKMDAATEARRKLIREGGAVILKVIGLIATLVAIGWTVSRWSGG